jgi:hypothetical protein
MPAVMHYEADRQLPRGHEIFLDHVGHFVGDAEAAAAALSRAGFAPTPPSVQTNPDPAGGPPQPTGTGNVTAMLRQGYIECLFKTADTPLGREFDASVARHAGVHLAAFAVAEPERTHARLSTEGFRMRPVVQMQRPVSTQDGEDVAAFTVVRLEPGQMPEGRIQLLTHRTEATVWQPRWLDHPNGALALTELAVVVDDVAEAAARFARLTGRPAHAERDAQLLQLDRGRLTILSRAAFSDVLPEAHVPQLPFLGAYGIRVRSMDTLQATLEQGGLPSRRSGAAVVASFPEALGRGAWIFHERADAMPWRP